MDYLKFFSTKYNINSLLYILPIVFTCLCAARNQHEIFSLPYSAMLVLLLLWGIFFKSNFDLHYLKQNIAFFLTLGICLLLQIISNKPYFDSIEAK